MAFKLGMAGAERWVGGAVVSLLLAAVMLVTGCAPRAARLGGAYETDEVIDELRRENLALRREVDQLSAAIERRMDQIDALEQQLRHDPDALAEQGVSAPRFTSLRFGRYSGFLDTSGDGRDNVLRLYIEPRDQDGRFMPVAARVEVQAVALVPGREPRVILDRRFTAAQFIESYRSGFMGTHYTLEMALPDDLPAELESAAVTLSLTDIATGVTRTREATMRLQR